MGNRLHKAYREGTELLEGISPGARFLLWVYCELADDFTLITWPSVAELHRLTGMSERSVQVHLRVLEQKGRLVKVEAGGGRKYKAAYRVEMGPQPRERPPGTEGAPAPPSRPKPGPKPGPSGGQSLPTKREREKAVAEGAIEVLRSLGIEIPPNLLGGESN